MTRISKVLANIVHVLSRAGEVIGFVRQVDLAVLLIVAI